MELNKKNLLLPKVNRIEDIIKALKSKFEGIEFEHETNFLNIVKVNLVAATK